MFYLLGSIVNSLGILPVIAVVILFVMVANLKKRVKNLELNSSARPSVPTEQPAVQADIPSDMQTQDQQLKPDVPQALAPADVPSVISKPSVAGNVFHWIREEWLFKLGALLLLLGFGWFVNTNNWLGPMGSTLLGVFVGTVLLILGAWRIKNDLHQGNIFLGGSLAFMGVQCIALATVLNRKYAPQYKVSSWLTYQYPIVIFLSLAIFFTTGTEVQTLNSSQILRVGILVFFNLGAFTSFTWLIQRVSALQVASVDYLVPVVGVTAGVIFLDETFNSNLIVAGIFIFISLIMNTREEFYT